MTDQTLSTGRVLFTSLQRWHTLATNNSHDALLKIRDLRWLILIPIILQALDYSISPTSEQFLKYGSVWIFNLTAFIPIRESLLRDPTAGDSYNLLSVRKCHPLNSTENSSSENSGNCSSLLDEHWYSEAHTRMPNLVKSTQGCQEWESFRYEIISYVYRCEPASTSSEPKKNETFSRARLSIAW